MQLFKQPTGCYFAISASILGQQESHFTAFFSPRVIEFGKSFEKAEKALFFEVFSKTPECSEFLKWDIARDGIDQLADHHIWSYCADIIPLLLLLNF